MSALPPEQMRAMRDTADQAKRPVDSLSQRWDELHEKAVGLAALAHLSPEAPRADRDEFAAMLANAQDWQRELAWQGIEDIDAMMQPGLAALNVLTERGIETAAPALALWREFHRAREAVVGLIGQPEAA